jgi:lipid A disaccharide synthetase
MLDVARRIAEAFPDVRFLVPTTAATHPVIESRLRADAGPGITAVSDRTTYERDAFDEMVPRCDLCVTVSGTATLHVAGFGVPMIVVYHGSPVLWNLVGRWLIRTRTYGLVNLLAAPSPAEADPARHVVPEFIPWYGSTEPVARLAIDYLRHPQRLEDQRRRLAGLIRSLDHPGASMAAARLALDLIRKRHEAAPGELRQAASLS